MTPNEPGHRLPAWNRDERARTLAAFASDVYGRPPVDPVDPSWELLAETPGPAGSLRRQIRITLPGRFGEARLTLLVQIPTVRSVSATAVPVFLGLNFLGNHTTTTDTQILGPAGIGGAEGVALHYDGKKDAADNLPARGAMAARSAWELVATRGYAQITACYLELGPDTPGIFDVALHPTVDTTRSSTRDPETWGAISLWTWALSRVIDALEQGMIPEIDPTRVIVHGHSRLGKTALWAAAQDERFAAAISNNSGCMGAAIDRPVGESHERITTAFPHWFTPTFNTMLADGDSPEVDQHQLMACIAPRPLYVASASEDFHADPEGEFLGWKLASAAWSGSDDSAATFPSAGGSAEISGHPLGYHLRPGKHGVQSFDWERWLDFADRWLGAH